MQSYYPERFERDMGTSETEWLTALPRALGDDVWEQLPNVKRLVDSIDTRPAAQRALALKDRYTFKTELDDVARRAMFPQNEKFKGTRGSV